MKNLFLIILTFFIFFNCDSQENQNYFELGKKEMAELNFERAINLFSEAIDKDQEKAESFFTRGLCYNLLKNFDKSTRDFTSAEALGYNDKKLYTLRGFAFNQIGQNDLALKDLNTAIEIDPEFYSKNYFNRAALKMKLQKYDEALIDFNEYLNRENDPIAYLERGKIFLAQNKKAKACADFEKAISLGNTNEELFGLRDLSCK